MILINCRGRIAEVGAGNELETKKGPQAEVVRSLERRIEERTGEVAAAEGRLADKDREIENLKRLLEQRYYSKLGSSIKELWREQHLFLYNRNQI